MRYCNAMKTATVALALLLSASFADAQRVGSHSRPAMHPSPTHKSARPAPPPPLLPSSKQPTSPFTAGPQTYAPRYDLPSTVRRPDGSSYFAPTFLGPINDTDVPADFVQPGRAPEPSRLISTTVEPPRVVASRGPDTFYVIPGCYAGNRPPDPQRLPKGCEIAKLRTTPIR